MSPRGGRREGAGRKPEDVEAGPGIRASLRLPADLSPDVAAYAEEHGLTLSKALARFIRLGVEAYRRKGHGHQAQNDNLGD